MANEFSSDSRKLLSYFDDFYNKKPSLLLLYDLENPEKPIRIPATDDLYSARWDFLGNRFLTIHSRPASVLDDGGYFIQVWDAKTGKPISEPFLVSHEEPGVSFSPDGNEVLVRRGKPLASTLLIPARSYVRYNSRQIESMTQTS